MTAASHEQTSLLKFIQIQLTSGLGMVRQADAGLQFCFMVEQASEGLIHAALVQQSCSQQRHASTQLYFADVQ